MKQPAMMKDAQLHFAWTYDENWCLSVAIW